MDLPEGARVLNVSIDLAVLGRTGTPPVKPTQHVIDEPVLRLASGTCHCRDRDLAEVFDFARDYLGLSRPPSLPLGSCRPASGSGQSWRSSSAALSAPGLWSWSVAPTASPWITPGGFTSLLAC